jgi:hypothetical protein
MSDRDKSDFYKTWKSIRKEMPPSHKIENPKNEYNKRDKSYMEPDVDEESIDEQSDEKAESFNLEEWNKKFNAPKNKSK